MDEQLPDRESDIVIQRQVLRQFLQESVAGQQVQHPALPRIVNLNWQGLKHSLSSTSREPLRQFESLRQLPQILATAQYSRYEPDNHNPPRKGVGVHVLYADCEFEGQKYQVWLRIRETPDGLFFYDLGVVR